MKKMLVFIVLFILISIVLIGLYSKYYNQKQLENSDYANILNDTDTKNNILRDTNIPKELKEIPSNYYSLANEQGTLVELYYDTYESMSYESKEKVLNKRAIVYLPYGYDDTNEYKVFYLMHGGWGNETTSLGTPDKPNMLKNVIDNSIENNELEPIIIVCPTYNNESPEDSGDFSLALQLNRNYYNELINDLIPAVESKYSTFAKSTTKEDLIASRNHRGFGGFSMGSVATWRTFQNALDYFSYFIPMSCGTSLDDENIFKSAEKYNQDDYFVYYMTGTSDFSYSYDNNRVEKMKNSKYFTSLDENKNGNFIYRIKEGYSHDGRASMEYTYNGLIYFFNNNENKESDNMEFTLNTKVVDVINNKNFEGFGDLIFPVDINISQDTTLENVGNNFMWYNYINPNKTVEIVNYLNEQAVSGEKIFYDIYTDEEKAKDPAKENTGLFFFRGKLESKVAIVNAGGGFSYVGAMHDSFPHALELSKKGYNAFALIYRPGSQTACEDLSRAIAFLHENADELEIDVENYSLWGGSAGARMATWVGTYGTNYFGEKDYPKPSAIIMQYTGFSEVTGNEPPTYNCVGTNDGIAPYRTMQERINRIKANGTNAEIEIFDGLPHGFGLGEGTVAEGWINNAITFWENQIK